MGEKMVQTLLLAAAAIAFFVEAIGDSLAIFVMTFGSRAMAKRRERGERQTIVRRDGEEKTTVRGNGEERSLMGRQS